MAGTHVRGASLLVLLPTLALLVAGSPRSQSDAATRLCSEYLAQPGPDKLAALRELGGDAVALLIESSVSANRRHRVRAQHALVSLSDIALRPTFEAWEFSTDTKRRLLTLPLTEMGAPAARLFVRSLTDPDDQPDALRALRRMQAHAEDALLDATGHEELRHRLAAISALAHIGGDRTLARLRRILEYHKLQERIAAADALGHRGDRASIPAFERLLQHRNDWLARSGARALARCGKEGMLRLFRLHRSADAAQRWLAREGFVAAGNVGAERLRGDLLEGSVADRHHALRCLACFEQLPGTGDWVLALFTDADAHVRRNAALLLARHGTVSDVCMKRLRSMLAEGHEIASFAVEALRELQNEEVDELLVLALLRGHAAQSPPVQLTKIVRSRGAKAAPHVFAALGTSLTPQQRARLVETLDGFGPAADPSLVASLADVNAIVRESARATMLRAERDLAPALRRSWDGLSPGERGRVLLELGEFPRFARKLHDLATANAAGPETTLRRAAARILGHAGLPPSQAISRLRPLLQDEDASVRREAVRALARQGSAARGALEELMTCPHARLRVLALGGLLRIGSVPLDTLLPMSSDSDAAVRRAWVHGMRDRFEFREKPVRERLLAMLEDPDPGVADSSRESLMTLGRLALPQAMRALQSRNACAQDFAVRFFEQHRFLCKGEARKALEAARTRIRDRALELRLQELLDK